MNDSYDIDCTKVNVRRIKIETAEAKVQNNFILDGRMRKKTDARRMRGDSV